MLLVKLITLRKLDLIPIKRIVMIVCISSFYTVLHAQDNSPYSRYGLGDQISTTSATTRGMGGVSAAYNNLYNVNFNNPSSYSFFQSITEPNSRKQLQGRVILDIGIDGQGRTLIDKNVQERFTSSNLIFNHVALGLPLRRNWGIAFGLRPMTSINYKIQQNGRIFDQISGAFIDSAQTTFEGSGGTYLASFGTGFKFDVGKNNYISLGVNGGYLFGSKDYTTRRTLNNAANDSTQYANGGWEKTTGIHGVYADAGIQYQGKINDKLYLGIGAYGNWKQKINTSRDELVATYTFNETDGYNNIDTISYATNVKGNFMYPTNITAGFVLQKPQTQTNAGWVIGVDYTTTSWQNYSENGIADTAVANNWKLKVGAEFSPAGKNSYFSHASYRLGIFTGPDYIKLRGEQAPIYGISAGIGLPLANYNQAARGQATWINLGFEYIKRGNNTSVLQENLYRLSFGFSLTDMWLNKRRNQ